MILDKKYLINKIYNLAIEGKSHGPFSTILDLYDSYNSSFVGKSLSGEHSTEFSFYTPLENELSLLGGSSLLKVKTGISDASLVLNDENFLFLNRLRKGMDKSTYNPWDMST